MYKCWVSFPEQQPWGRILVNCPNCGIVFSSEPFGYGNKPLDLVKKAWNLYAKKFS